MRLLKISIILILFLTFCGCTYKASPYPMKRDMISTFHAESSLHIKNVQKKEIVNMEGVAMQVNLKEATEAAINLLESELVSCGVKRDENSSRSLALSIDKLHYSNYFMTVGCTATISVETGNGLKKIVKEHNISGIGLPQACDFALTKAIASIVNDREIVNYIITGSSSYPNIEEKLIDLKKLLDSGLITGDEYNVKRAKLIQDM